MRVFYHWAGALAQAGDNDGAWASWSARLTVDLSGGSDVPRLEVSTPLRSAPDFN